MVGKPVYELRLKNVSRLRAVVDLRVTVLLETTGLKMFPGSRGTTKIVLPVLHYAHNILRLKAHTGFRVIRLDLDNTFQAVDEYHRTTFRLDKYDPADIDPLEYLLSQGKNATLVVEMLGCDAWTGSRKYFESPGYKLEHIVHGQFVDLNIERFTVSEKDLSSVAQGDSDSTSAGGEKSGQLNSVECQNRQKLWRLDIRRHNQGDHRRADDGSAST